MQTTLDPRQALAAAMSTPNEASALRSRRSLKKSCQEFEAIFIQSLFKEMRKTVPEGGLFPRSTATEMYRDMLDQEVAKKVAERQSIGLAEQMYRQMERRLPGGA
ncbi:MAG: rod-binding protein [Desulfobulbus sp.]|jgi:flagellar protein FlgJ|nr:rod-binding protein [Desulfobulbus sp.]